MAKRTITEISRELARTNRELARLESQSDSLFRSLSKSLSLDQVLVFAGKIPPKKWEIGGGNERCRSYETKLPQFPLVVSLDREGLEDGSFYHKPIGWDSANVMKVRHQIEDSSYETSLSVYRLGCTHNYIKGQAYYLDRLRRWSSPPIERFYDELHASWMDRWLKENKIKSPIIEYYPDSKQPKKNIMVTSQ